MKPAWTIVDLAEGEEIKSVNLATLTVCFATVLHAS
jgi:hypothetical protein